MVLKVSRCSRKFPDFLGSFLVVWKGSRSFRKFLDGQESFQMVWKVLDGLANCLMVLKIVGLSSKVPDCIGSV